MNFLAQPVSAAQNEPLVSRAHPLLDWHYLSHTGLNSDCGGNRFEHVAIRGACRMSKRLRVLIVDDSEDDTELLVHGLTQGGFEPEFERVETPAAMAAALSNRTWDVIISDYSLPHFNALGLGAVVGAREVYRSGDDQCSF
jgi:PleD family two-component response regulator